MSKQTPYAVTKTILNAISGPDFTALNVVMLDVACQEVCRLFNLGEECYSVLFDSVYDDEDTMLSPWVFANAITNTLFDEDLIEYQN